ncbi:hypothetical protein PSM36_1426 [Proteiniphilum saccharofermentans]|uniref:Uncharacterized protein n=1 Tax=Proteiniphilum saccharofermentans TaxID=1642647 RepID=A0A1R3T4M2_9BACT|nr:hypothetical protein PSM36_1426 [Proteiniphilum saccharofermentans]
MKKFKTVSYHMCILYYFWDWMPLKSKIDNYITLLD